jgi:hypothetical protein
MPYTENCSSPQAAARQRCRNPNCRVKLSAPVENEHHAFCCQPCYEGFYRTRCCVCERDITIDPMSGERRNGSSHRKYCGRKCGAEARKFPWVYGPPPGSRATPKTSDISKGIWPHKRDPRCLRDWSWGGDPDRGDHSLYAAGLTVALIVLPADGRYHLHTPVTRPPISWPNLEVARRGAESFALMAIPLASVDPKLTARIKRDNATPHPAGPPLNRQPLPETAIASDWRPVVSATTDIPDIPAFLRRTKHVPPSPPERPALCRPVSGRRTQSHSWPSLAPQDRVEMWVSLRLGRGNP